MLVLHVCVIDIMIRAIRVSCSLAVRAMRACAQGGAKVFAPWGAFAIREFERPQGPSMIPSSPILFRFPKNKSRLLSTLHASPKVDLWFSAPITCYIAIFRGLEVMFYVSPFMVHRASCFRAGEAACAKRNANSQHAKTQPQSHSPLLEVISCAVSMCSLASWTKRSTSYFKPWSC